MVETEATPTPELEPTEAGKPPGKIKRLVIVESPAKAKTIKKYLGHGFTVKASVGHVKDLPTKTTGVDVENGFTPSYEVIKGKQKVIDEILASAKEVHEILLAPDPDREGEAIAWHIAEEIRPINPNIQRILFNEITRKGVAEGLEHCLWQIGGVPQEHRTDHLSAAIRPLDVEGREQATARYKALLAHHGLEPTANNAGEAHENGDVEQAHHRFKVAVDQALRVRAATFPIVPSTPASSRTWSASAT